MNINLDFADVLTRAWRLTWKHKILWIFGILAGLGRGGGGGGGNNFQFDQSNFDFGPGGPNLPPNLERQFEGLDPNVVIALGIGLVCLGLLIAIVFFVLQVIGRGGLIGGLVRADASGAVTFGEAWAVGVRKFWTLFIIGLVIGIPLLIVVLILIVPTILLGAATFGIGLLCLIPVICVVVILAVAAGIFGYFAQLAAVIEDLNWSAAFSRAWQVIRANLGNIIILGLIVLVIGGILGFVIGLPFLLIVAPALLAVAGVAGGSQALTAAGIGLALACCAVYLPIAIVLSGVLETWTTAAFTLAYQKFTGEAPAAPQAAPPIVTA